MDRCSTEAPALDPAGSEEGHLSACWLPHRSEEREELRRRLRDAEPVAAGTESTGSVGAGE
jgi:hypothetical protein